MGLRTLYSSLMTLCSVSEMSFYEAGQKQSDVLPSFVFIIRTSSAISLMIEIETLETNADSEAAADQNEIPCPSPAFHTQALDQAEGSSLR